VVIATLALGIGGNIAIFSVLRGVVLIPDHHPWVAGFVLLGLDGSRSNPSCLWSPTMPSFPLSLS